MRTAIFILFCLQWIWSAFFYFGTGTASPPETPVLEFDSSVLNAGVQPCGTEWSGTAVLTNTGEVSVRIEKVAKSCGCTEAKLKGSEILQSGDQAEIALSVKVATKDGVKTEVDVLCEFVAVESTMRGLARMKIQISSHCDKPVEVPDPIPVPDPRFGRSKSGD